MRRFAVLAMIVVLVASPIVAVELTRNARAQDPLPTPKGQLGGAPSLSTTVPVPAEETPEGTSPPAEPSCAGAFAADIHQGPSTGRSFVGILSLAVDPSGAIDDAAIVTTAG